jgi:hypothetical protein
VAVPDNTQDRVYRSIVDRLVSKCRSQGQISAKRVRRGVWNANATANFMPEQHALNIWLAGLSSDHRELLAGILKDEYVAGMHDALVVLYDAEIPPFDKAYEGDPHHDFIGRLDDWQWPVGESRT